MRIKSLLLLFIVFCAPYFAYACRCNFLSVLEAYGKSSLVIKGTIIKIERFPEQYKMTFRIEKLYKGDVTDSLVIITTSTSSCGMTRGIAQGQTGIIFSERDESGYFAHQCLQPLKRGYYEEEEIEATLEKKTLRKEKKS